MHWKNSLLVIQIMLRLFVNTLRVNGTHYLINRDNLTRAIQIQLYQNKRLSVNLFFAFLKCMLNFKHLPKKDDPHS